ncbi:MAG: hypothetical protein ABIY90_16675, partial [Puia sp.]
CFFSTTGVFINSFSLDWLPYWQAIGSVCLLTGMVCWVTYWVRIAKIKNRLNKMAEWSTIPLPQTIN